MTATFFWQKTSLRWEYEQVSMCFAGSNVRRVVLKINR